MFKLNFNLKYSRENVCRGRTFLLYCHVSYIRINSHNNNHDSKISSVRKNFNFQVCNFSHNSKTFDLTYIINVRVKYACQVENMTAKRFHTYALD